MTEVLTIYELDKMVDRKTVLSNINLTVNQNQLIALISSDKTESETLLRILAGFMQSDNGTLNFNNKPYNCTSIRDALQKGVLMITAGANIAPDLTIKENLILGLNNKIGLTDISQALTAAGLDKFPVNTPAYFLSLSERYFLLLARALISNAKLFLFDSIDEAFSKDQRQRYFNILNRLKSNSKSVIFIPAIIDKSLTADKYFILKDGSLSEVNSIDNNTLNKLYSLEDKSIFTATEHFKQAKVVLETIGLKGNILQDASINIRENKIYGITGLKGSGLEEFFAIITGSTKATGGVLSVNKNNISSKTITSVKTVKAGINVFNGIRENKLSFISRKNKLLSFKGNIIVLLNPVSGLNNSEKNEFYIFLEELKKMSKAIIMYTPSFMELQNVCDEIAIIFNGELSAARESNNWNNEEIYKYVTSGKLEAFSIL